MTHTHTHYHLYRKYRSHKQKRTTSQMTKLVKTSSVRFTLAPIENWKEIRHKNAYVLKCIKLQWNYQVVKLTRIHSCKCLVQCTWPYWIALIQSFFEIRLLYEIVIVRIKCDTFYIELNIQQINPSEFIFLSQIMRQWNT